MNSNLLLRTIGVLGSLACAAGLGRFSPALAHDFPRTLRKAMRVRDQHPGTYIGCKRPQKFATVTRQRMRRTAQIMITEQLRAQYGGEPRRILRDMARVRARREWLNFGKAATA